VSKDEGRQCHFCSRPVTEDEFCFGCGVHICSVCDVNINLMGHGHAPEDHREEPDDDEVA
jgi:hypothetical protein